MSEKQTHGLTFLPGSKVGPLSFHPSLAGTFSPPSKQPSWFGFLTLSGSFLLLLLRFTEWINGCHSPTANIQTDHRRQNANFWGWHRRSLPPGSLRSPFPTQTYIPGTWKYLNLPHMPSCFTLWMLFWGKNVQNSLKILSRVVQMPELPCRYHRTMYVCTIHRKLNADEV